MTRLLNLVDGLFTPIDAVVQNIFLSFLLLLLFKIHLYRVHARISSTTLWHIHVTLRLHDGAHAVFVQGRAEVDWHAMPGTSATL